MRGGERGGAVLTRPTDLHELRDGVAAMLATSMPHPRVTFTIGDVARGLDETTVTIRYWSDCFPRYLSGDRGLRPVGPTDEPARVGRRLYSRKDVVTLGVIQWLVRVELYTLAGAERQLQQAADAERTLRVVAS